MSHPDTESIVNNDEISIRALIYKIKIYFRYILSKWLIIVIAGIIGAGVGVRYAMTQKRIYTAELSFALQDDGAGGAMSGALGLASQFGLDVGGGGAGGEFSGDNLLELIKSRSMIERTLLSTVNINGKSITLAEYYINYNKLRKDWKDTPAERVYFLPNADRSTFSRQQDSVLGSFHSKLIAKDLIVDKLDKKLSIISVRVRATDEFFAKVFTETLVKVVSDFYIQTKTKRGVQNVNILQNQADSVRRVLSGSISGVASSVDANPNPNPMLQSLRVPSQRGTVNVEVNKAILGELVKNLELAKMTVLQQTPLIQVIDRPILPLRTTKLGKVKALVIGGFIGGFLMVIILVIKKGLSSLDIQ